MKKILSGILALTLAGALTMPAFAAEGAAITATNVTTKVGTEPEATVAPESLKENAADEENMLRISPSTLLKIKLKLEGGNEGNDDMTFFAGKNLANDETLTADKIQFIDQKATDSNGAVSIQFRPRITDTAGIYKMQASVKGAERFNRFYKTVKDQIQPTLTNASDTPKKQDIEINVNGYTEDWKKDTLLYEVINGAEEEIPVDDYSFVTSQTTSTTAKLKIKTTGAWATVKPHKLRLKSTNVAYNLITFDVNITQAIKEYTVSFNESGINNISFAENAIPAGGVTLPTPEKTGYTFGGWYKEAAFTNAVTSPITATKLTEVFGEGTSITLYAKWTPVTYTITYHNMDGITNTNPTSYTVETNTITLTAPEKTGHDFGGWYSDSEFNTEVTEIAQGSTESKELYAKWTPVTYTITYNKDNGVIAEENNYTSYTYGEGIMLPTPTKDGFHFIGWYDNEQLSGSPVSSVKVIDIGNKEFWAKWDENAPTEYQITFVDYDGTELQKTMVGVDKMPSCDAPSREADDKYTYAFSGWNPEIVAVSTNASYRATYTSTPRTYTVTYEKNGGTIADEDNYTSYTYGTALTLPVPTKDGYDFDGWYSDSEFTAKVTEIANTATGDKTVYAKWNSTVNYKLISVDETNGTVKLIKRPSESAWLIVATYTANGNLVKASIKDISNIQTTATSEDIDVAGAFEGEYAKVKVFMWNSLDKMQPRCEALPVNK